MLSGDESYGPVGAPAYKNGSPIMSLRGRRPKQSIHMCPQAIRLVESPHLTTVFTKKAAGLGDQTTI